MAWVIAVRTEGVFECEYVVNDPAWGMAQPLMTIAPAEHAHHFLDRREAESFARWVTVQLLPDSSKRAEVESFVCDATTSVKEAQG